MVDTNKIMKILITGSAGFIGSHLVEELELKDLIIVIVVQL